jgi:adenylylsulfate kinase-like enzyme
MGELSFDELRPRLTANPTYSAEERDWFYGIITFLAELLTTNGLNILIAAASPRVYRQAVWERIACVAEVHVECPPEVWRSRDPKGLRERADRVEITNLSGAGGLRETPDAPEARADTARRPAEAAVRRILRQTGARDLPANGTALDSTSYFTMKG